jgi:hypothetical protein
MTPMLGDVLREARSAADALDPALRAAVAAVDGDAGAFARQAVASFERHASEEDWTTLLSSIRRAAQPGAACLAIMVRWRLRHLGHDTAPAPTPAGEAR